MPNIIDEAITLLRLDHHTAGHCVSENAVMVAAEIKLCPLGPLIAYRRTVAVTSNSQSLFGVLCAEPMYTLRIAWVSQVDLEVSDSHP